MRPRDLVAASIETILEIGQLGLDHRAHMRRGVLVGRERDHALDEHPLRHLLHPAQPRRRRRVREAGLA